MYKNTKDQTSEFGLLQSENIEQHAEELNLQEK